jgi:hypothetical protein
MTAPSRQTMSASVDTLIICSCDQTYFPLAKGLVLSILDAGPLPAGVGLGFVDIGCEPAAIEWLLERNVMVRRPDEGDMGILADPGWGYRRSQLCRPFLPALFPQVPVLIWIDCDSWVQDASIFPCLRAAVRREPDKLFIAPEFHYSYTKIIEDAVGREQELFSYYEPAFGRDIAEPLSMRPPLNTGLFAMSAGNPLWQAWGYEVRRLYGPSSRDLAPRVRHMMEQTALNGVARRIGCVVLIDPLYNYLSLWTRPKRDAEGVVRVALPPHLPIGIIHLAGGWKHFGRDYFNEGLLYRCGDYLTESDRSTLFPDVPRQGVR